LKNHFQGKGERPGWEERGQPEEKQTGKNKWVPRYQGKGEKSAGELFLKDRKHVHQTTEFRGKGCRAGERMAREVEMAESGRPGHIEVVLVAGGGSVIKGIQSFHEGGVEISGGGMVQIRPTSNDERE